MQEGIWAFRALSFRQEGRGGAPFEFLNSLLARAGALSSLSCEAIPLALLHANLVRRQYFFADLGSLRGVRTETQGSCSEDIRDQEGRLCFLDHLIGRGLGLSWSLYCIPRADL